MSTDPRRQEDPDVGLRAWPQLLARMEGAVVPCRLGAYEWWSEDPAEQAKAARACQACQLLEACRAFGLATSESHGVWGGLTPAERKRIRREQKKKDEAA